MVAILSTVFIASAAPSILQTFQGGTGSSTPSGILYGDNNSTTHLNTVTIGSGCTFSGGTLACAGTGSGVFSFTPTTNYSATANATNTPIWFKQGLQASSTAILTQVTIPGSSDNMFLNENNGGVGNDFNISVPNSGSLTIGSADYLQISSTNKDVVVNPNIIAGGATHGFLRIPASAGTPGVPLNDGSYASRSMAFDSTNSKLLVYNGGWINIGAFSFTPTTYGNSTSTRLGFLNGFLSTASSTIVGNATTTGTFFAGIASSTSLFGAGLNTCNSGNVLTWSGGIFGCATDAQGAGTFSFTATSYGNSTSTLIGFLNGILVNAASSTITGNATTTGTFFAGIASSTSLFGANLNTCNAGNVLTWAAGKFGCVADAQGAGTYPFTPSTDNGIKTSATSTPIQGTNPGLGLDISDTSWYGIGGHIFAYGSTTNQSTILGLDAGGNNATTSATADNTTAIGFWALKSNVGANNTAVGSNALFNNTTGSSNIAFGSSALYGNTTGNSNAAFGLSAMQDGTNGTRNTAFGSNSLQGTTGSNNVGIGQRSGISNTSGKGNTYIGAFADTGVVNLSTSTAIGAGSSVNASNSLVLGGSTNNSVLVGIGTSSPFARLSIHANTDDTVSNNTLFAIGSSTASVVSTLFSVSNTGLASTTNLIISGAGGPAGCATFSSVGQISNTGTACGTGSFSFLPAIYGSQAVNSTSTGLWVTSGATPYGLIASSTFTTYASTTQLSISSTAYFPTGVWNPSGMVGIGTTTPQWALQIATSSGPQLTLSDGTGSNAPFNFRAAGTTFYLSTSSPGTFATGTNPIMIIDASQTASTSVLIATSSNANATFAVDGRVFMKGLTGSGAGQSIDICANASNELIADTGVCIVSDERSKDITGNYTGALDKIRQLNALTYFFKPKFNGALQINPNLSREQLGFTAQGLSKVDPKLVDVYADDGSNTVFSYKKGEPRAPDTYALVTLALAGIKELDAKTGGTRNAAEENWQNILIGILFGYMVYNEITKRRK